MHKHTRTHTHTHIHTHTCACTHTHTHTHPHMCAHTHTHTHLHWGNSEVEDPDMSALGWRGNGFMTSLSYHMLTNVALVIRPLKASRSNTSDMARPAFIINFIFTRGVHVILIQQGFVFSTFPVVFTVYVQKCWCLAWRWTTKWTTVSPPKSHMTHGPVWSPQCCWGWNCAVSSTESQRLHRRPTVLLMTVGALVSPPLWLHVLNTGLLCLFLVTRAPTASITRTRVDYLRLCRGRLINYYFLLVIL